MKAFSYGRARSLADAAATANKPGFKIIAGGTNLLDLMKLQVETPSALVDINRLPLDKIEETSEGGCGSGGRAWGRRNDFKIPLTRRTLHAVLGEITRI